MAKPAAASRVSRSFDHELAAESQNERDDRNRDRPAHAIRSDDERDARPRAGVHIDRVVADAEAGDDGEATVRVDALFREAVREKNQRVEIRELVGFQRIARLKIGKLDIRRLTQRFEVEVGIDRRSVGLAEIAGQGDAKRRAHRLLPVFFGFSAATQPSRNLSIASLSASCSTQTSPE